MSDKPALVTKTPKRKRLSVLGSIGILLGLAIIMWGIYSLPLGGVNPGPSFIEELRAGTITEADIKSTEIVKFDPGGGWPFSEREYARKARKRIGSRETKDLIGILKNSSTNGHKHRNHPATLYYGILRIDLVESGHYYVFYHLGYYEAQYYVYVDANSKNSTNPNGAEEYENIPLAGFLKRNDPWYRDADSPETWHRPSFPDNVP